MLNGSWFFLIACIYSSAMALCRTWSCSNCLSPRNVSDRWPKTISSNKEERHSLLSDDLESGLGLGPKMQFHKW